MSIFGKSSSQNVNVPVFEGYHSQFNGDLLAVQEGYEDQLAIVEAIYTLDMEDLALRRDIKVLKESGADSSEIIARFEKFDVVAEGMVSNVWDKIKTFFTKMLGKIKAFFASVIRYFDGFFKSGKDFATKYEKQLRALTLNGFEYKMFNYTNIDSGDSVSNFMTIAGDVVDKVFPGGTTIDALDKEIETYEDNKEDILNEIRGKYCGESNLSSDEYTEQLYRHFRNGAKDDSDKDDIKVNIGEIINTLKDTKPLKKAEDALKDCEKVFQKAINDFNKLEKSIQKDADNTKDTSANRDHNQKLVSTAQKHSSLFSEAKTIALEYFRAWKEAVVARGGEYKSVCTAAFRYKKKA